MDLNAMLSLLDGKDTSQGFAALKELERLSEQSDALYPCLGRFVEMIGSEKYVVRVRGFRLFCKQARWDAENLTDKNIDRALVILNDEKPTAVRQALAALRDVVPYKSALRGKIKKSAESIDFLRYRDTMQGLILKDIERLLALIARESR